MTLRQYFNFDSAINELTHKHQKRVAKDPDFNFMKARRALADEADSITHLPLNIEDRKALEDSENQKLLAIENTRRQAKGLSVLTDLAEAEKEESDKQTEKTKNNEPLNAIDENDPVLIEASQILLDAFPYYQASRVAKTVTGNSFINN